MRFTVNLNSNELSNSKEFFDVYLKSKMKEFIGLNLSDSRFKVIQDYVQEEYKSTITIETLTYAIDSMRRTDNGYLHSFEINNNVMCNEVSEEKLIIIIKLVEYGNLSIKGLGIFQNLFDYIKDNITLLVEDYTYSR